MEIRDNDKVCIIAPICNVLDKRRVSKILEKIQNETREVALDLTYVRDCTEDFIECLKKMAGKNIGIFNIPSDIFVLFNLMGIDKSVKLFVSEIDFMENSRQLINRKFSVV